MSQHQTIPDATGTPVAIGDARDEHRATRGGVFPRCRGDRLGRLRGLALGPCAGAAAAGSESPT